AYGRAAATRSCVRFILDVATISSVRVILRVFSTDLMRVLSSRPLAIGVCHSERFFCHSERFFCHSERSEEPARPAIIARGRVGPSVAALPQDDAGHFAAGLKVLEYSSIPRRRSASISLLKTFPLRMPSPTCGNCAPI